MIVSVYSEGWACDLITNALLAEGITVRAFDPMDKDNRRETRILLDYEDNTYDVFIEIFDNPQIVLATVNKIIVMVNEAVGLTRHSEPDYLAITRDVAERR
jgi:hypothetical protein